MTYPPHALTSQVGRWGEGVYVDGNEWDESAGGWVAMGSDGKRVLLLMASASDIPTVPAEIFSKFQISFYADLVDAVYKALGGQ